MSRKSRKGKAAYTGKLAAHFAAKFANTQRRRLRKKMGLKGLRQYIANRRSRGLGLGRG